MENLTRYLKFKLTVLLCYHDNKASDVVKSIPFLKPCYKTNNMRPFSFIPGTFLMFDPCRNKMLLSTFVLIMIEFHTCIVISGSTKTTILV